MGARRASTLVPPRTRDMVERTCRSTRGGMATCVGSQSVGDELLSQPLKRGSRRVAPVFLVEQVMTHDTTSLTEDMPVREAVEKFVTTGTSGFPVMDKDGGTELKGILSLADILWHEAMEEIIEEEKANMGVDMLRKVESDAARTFDKKFLKGCVRDVMKAEADEPMYVARTDMIVSEAAAIMLTHSLTRLPVLDKEGKVVGVLTRGDIMRTIAAAMM